MFATFTIGLYLNDEFPWEAHQHVVSERHYGAALMNAWPALTGRRAPEDHSAFE